MLCVHMSCPDDMLVRWPSHRGSQINTHLHALQTGIAAKLLGCRDVRVYHDLTFFKDGQGKGAPTPWHQDGYYW